MKLLVLLAALLCLTGCSPDAPPVPEERPAVEQAETPVPYDLYLYTDDNRYLAIDTEGHVVMEVADGQMGILRTDGLASGIAVQRSEGVMTDEYGWKSPEKTWCDIYSVTGEYEYTVPLSYVGQEGAFLEGYDMQTQTTKLYRFSDGALIMDDVHACHQLGDYIYVNQKDWSAPGMFLDSNGDVVSRVPEDYTTAGSILDQYLIVAQNGLTGLMRPDGSLVLPCQYQELRTGQLGCVTVKDENGWHAIQAETGDILFSSPTRIQYLLPEAAIVAVDEEESEYQLVAFDGTPLMDRQFSWPSSHDVENDGFPELFSAQTNDYSDMLIFRPDGTVVYETKSDCYVTILSEDAALLSQYLDDENRNLWAWLDLRDGTQTPLPAVYENTYYNPLYSEHGMELGFFSRGGSNELGWYRTDILDAEGNVVLEGLQDMLYRGDGIFQCSRGFTSGLLRLDGTWLYEESSFSALTDD